MSTIIFMIVFTKYVRVSGDCLATCLCIIIMFYDSIKSLLVVYNTIVILRWGNIKQCRILSVIVIYYPSSLIAIIYRSSLTSEITADSGHLDFVNHFYCGKAVKISDARRLPVSEFYLLIITCKYDELFNMII